MFKDYGLHRGLLYCCFICGEQTQRLITGRYFHYICERCVNALYALLQRQ
jgi:hypothetical protein